MAKKSMVERELKRTKVVRRYAAQSDDSAQVSRNVQGP